jgi:hypothetical protein
MAATRHNLPPVYFLPVEILRYVTTFPRARGKAGKARQTQPIKTPTRPRLDLFRDELRPLYFVIKYKQTNFFFLFIPSVQKLARRTSIRLLRSSCSCYLLPVSSLLQSADALPCPALALFQHHPVPPSSPNDRSGGPSNLKPAALHSNNSTYNPRTQLRIVGRKPLQSDVSIRFPLTSTVHTYSTATARFRHIGKERRETDCCAVQLH